MIQPIFLQRLPHLALPKAKTFRVFFGSNCYHIQIVQTREHGLPAHPGNTCHNCPLQIWIRFKGGVKQTSGKRRQLLPVPIYIRFLHRRIIFIQKDDHPFSIIPLQKSRHNLQRFRSRIVFHISGYIPIKFYFLLIQKFPIQQMIISIVQLCDNVAQLFSRIFKGCLLYAGKAEHDHRINSLKSTVRLLFPYGQPLKYFSPPCVFDGEKPLQHIHIQSFSKTPGTGDQCHIAPAFPPLSDKICFIDIKIAVFY